MHNVTKERQSRWKIQLQILLQAGETPHGELTKVDFEHPAGPGPRFLAAYAPHILLEFKSNVCIHAISSLP